MAYIVSDRFKEIVYSGGAKYKAQLTINNIPISNKQIKNIKISNPCIDTNQDYFYIGTFISNSLTIVFRNFDGIDIKSGYEVILNIGLNVDGTYEYVPIGKYIIDKLSEDYQTKCEITCLDYAVKFKPATDYSPCFVNGKATIDTILAYICTKFGITLGTYPTINGNIEIGTYDSTVSGKQWISYIAEIKGCNAKIDRNGQLCLIPFKQSPSSIINAIKGKSWSLGEKYKISRVIYFDAIRNYTYGNETNNTLYIRQDNPFIADTNTISNLYNSVKDAEYYALQNENIGDISLDATDCITYKLGSNTYNTLNNCELTYEMDIISKVNVKIPTKQQEVTTNVEKANTDVEIKKVKAEVNSLTAEVNILSEKVVDISTTTIGNGSVQISNATASSLYNLTITGDIIVPYTCDGMLGTNSLQSGTIKSGIGKSRSYKKYCKSYITLADDLYTADATLTVYKSGDIYKQYMLPTVHLNIFGTIFDEFRIDNNVCTIIRRVGINNNGSKYLLKNPIVENYDDFIVEIPEGDCTITLDSFPNAKLSATYLNKNDYTQNFATKVDVTSQIKVASNEVLIESKSQILDNGDEVIASINTTSTGNVKIKGSKSIALEGLTTINDNFKVLDDGSIEATNGTFEGDVTANNLYLNTGGKVIGGDGLLNSIINTTLGEYKGWTWLGYDAKQITDGSTLTYTYNYSDLTIDVYIPQNFVITKAYLIFQHTPIYWQWFDNSSNSGFVWGHSNNLALYVASSTSYNYSFNMGYYSDFTSESLSNSSLSKIYDIGDPNNTSGSSIYQGVSEIPIGNFATNANNKFVIRRKDGESSGNSSTYGAASMTGMGKATIIVYGYSKFQ